MNFRFPADRWRPGLRRVRVGIATSLLALAATGPVHALPMASQGFVMVMGEAEDGSTKLSANYALTGRDALGVATARFDSPAHGAAAMHSSREYAALTYTRLLHRWNLPDAQANLWFVGQAGGLRGQGLAGGTRTLLSPAVLADWETTRLYVGAGAQALRAGDWRLLVLRGRVRAGAALAAAGGPARPRDHPTRIRSRARGRKDRVDADAAPDPPPLVPRARRPPRQRPPGLHVGSLTPEPPPACRARTLHQPSSPRT